MLLKPLEDLGLPLQTGLRWLLSSPASDPRKGKPHCYGSWNPWARTKLGKARVAQKQTA